MAKRRFKNGQMQRAYECLTAQQPERGQGGVGEAFWRGHDAPDHKPLYARDSLAFAAWAAGVDARKAEESPQAPARSRRRASGFLPVGKTVEALARIALAR